MALPDTAKIVFGTPLVFANSGEYSPSDAGQPATIDADIDLGALAASSAALRQSVKLELDAANLDLVWEMKGYFEWHSAPTAGGILACYLSWSNDATAGEDNTGGCDGTDSAYQGYGADVASGIEALGQLDRIGSIQVTADAALQVTVIGEFIPQGTHCCLVVDNGTDVNLANTDAIETGVAIYPKQHQIQD